MKYIAGLDVSLEEKTGCVLLAVPQFNKHKVIAKHVHAIFATAAGALDIRPTASHAQDS